ncbi:MAG: uracil-DNA glycosylase [Bacteroidetes bacterium]|nr:uracil-DNA glycosylase [Bacteroidota bacterium]
MISKELLEKIFSCTKCESIPDHEKFDIHSHGNLNAEYMLVSEAPAIDSLDAKRYWSGNSGKLLRSCLQGLDVELEDLFYLNDIVKCWTGVNGTNRKPTDQEISNCGHFLIKEILELEPKLILAFGNVVSSYLLKRRVGIKEEHGKIYTIGNKYKVLVLLHPSNIDFSMKRETYKSQISSLFKALYEKKLEKIPNIFPETITEAMPELPQKPSNNDPRSFIIPSSGNSITDSDISAGQLRITIDFKDYFPKESCRLKVIIGGETYNASFTYKIGRSHVLRIGGKAMEKLGIEPYGSVRLKKISIDTYELKTV